MPLLFIFSILAMVLNCSYGLRSYFVVVQTEKAILILLQLQLATEVTNKITDTDQIIVDIEGSNEAMLGSMTNSLIIKVVVVTVYRKKKKDFFLKKKINELILESIYRSFT